MEDALAPGEGQWEDEEHEYRHLREEEEKDLSSGVLALVPTIEPSRCCMTTA